MILPILLVHIISALSSMALTAYAFFRPSRTLLRVDSGLVVMTMATATYLIWTNPANLVSSCTTGLIYLGAVLVGMYLAQRKLANSRSEV